MSSKAQGLSMGVVVTAALAVIVLLLVGVFFSGGFRSLGGKITTFVSGTTGSTEDVEKSGITLDCDRICSRVALGLGPVDGSNPPKAGNCECRIACSSNIGCASVTCTHSSYHAVCIPAGYCRCVPTPTS